LKAHVYFTWLSFLFTLSVPNEVYSTFNFLHISLFRFAFVDFVSFRFHFVDFVSFRFVFVDFVSCSNVIFLFVFVSVFMNYKVSGVGI
jgi:hypothetical protein